MCKKIIAIDKKLWYYKKRKKGERNGDGGHSSMRNHIAKTALISFVAAAMAVVIFCFGCVLIAPSFASGAVYGMGMYSYAARLAETAYNRAGTDEALCTLVERAIVAEDYDLLAEYGEEYLNSEYFENKAKAPQNALYSNNYRGYVAGSVAVSQYVRGDVQVAVQTAMKNVADYGEYNSVQYLMRAVVSRGDKAAAQTLLGGMTALSLEGQAAQRLSDDVALLQTFIAA